MLRSNIKTAPSTAISNTNHITLNYTELTYKEQIRSLLRDLPTILKTYTLGLVPIIQWIHRYNLRWLLQDVIAGITVGMLIVPQGIAYAKIANLDPQYGLYTSFVGVTIYCIFGTSKDISIGPITVVSLLVGQAVTKVTEAHPNITGPEVAVCLSLFAGIVTILIGLTRLGILVDFISEPAIAGYMTGSAITISLGQWPKVFGLKQVNTHQSPYLIVYEFFKYLGNTQLDAAFGLTALVTLYAIKVGGARLAQRYPNLQKAFFYLGIMRSGLVVIFGTLMSFIINHRRVEMMHGSIATKPLISIIQKVPAGFSAMAVPNLNMTILKEASDVLPSIILILILEHVSVAKSFGRMSNYMIDPNQEILAIGVSNLIGSFFGAYPATGAFSRTAVMARSGAKTPMAGVFSGAIVVLALYALTPAFFYIPEACLGAVVIHAVIDLVSGTTFLKALWRSSILEFLIFVTAVVITCFMDVETAIYVSVALSLLLMLLRLARPKVSTLGRVRVSSSLSKYSNHAPSVTSSTSTRRNHSKQLVHHQQLSKSPFAGVEPIAAMTVKDVVEDVYGYDKNSTYIYVEEPDPHFLTYLDPLPPGIVVIRISNAILYPNANFVMERIMDIVKSKTRAGNNKSNYRHYTRETTTATKKRKFDRGDNADWRKKRGRNVSSFTTPNSDYSDSDNGHFELDNDAIKDEEANWNSSSPSKSQKNLAQHLSKPCLEAIVFDFAAVDRLDATGLHTLHAIQHTLHQYTNGNKRMEWHFSQLPNAQVRRLLIDSGFGTLPLLDNDQDSDDYDFTNYNSSSSCDDAYIVELENGYLPKCSRRKDKSKNRRLKSCQDLFNEAYIPKRPIHHYDGTIQSVRDAMGAMMIEDYNEHQHLQWNEENEDDISKFYTGNNSNNVITSLPEDSYPAFHWDMDAAIQSICSRREEAKQQDLHNNPSSTTVRVY